MTVGDEHCVSIAVVELTIQTKHAVQLLQICSVSDKERSLDLLPVI